MKITLITLLLIFGCIPISFADSEYSVKIDEHEYVIKYNINAELLAMDIDKEQKSLLIGIENTKESFSMIEIPKEMLDAKNNEFSILIDEFEADYTVNESTNSTKLSFFMPADTQEIEIIGTFVIPEFSFILLIFFITMTMMFLTRNTILK